MQDVIDWTQYVNGAPGTSPMSKYRQQNGREQPWKVKIWGIGNEAWGCGGNMKPDYYANIYRQNATFMTDWNNSDRMFRVASGANGDDYTWTETLMKEIPHNLVEGLALHHYANVKWSEKGSATDYSETQYFATMKSALRMEELVTKHSAIMDKYDPERKIALVVDEWGGWYNVEPGTNPGFLYQQNTMRDAMIAGLTLNIFHNHCERVRMANLAQTVNVLQAVILTNKEKMIITPTYHVMEMYNVHQDATMLPMNIISRGYILGNERLPAVSISASKDKNGITHISLVNIDASQTQDVSIQVNGAKLSSVTGRMLTAKKLQDYNSFDAPDNIKPIDFNGANLSGGSLQVSLPPFSVVVLTLK